MILGYILLLLQQPAQAAAGRIEITPDRRASWARWRTR